jgi:uncharacterized protein YwqG
MCRDRTHEDLRNLIKPLIKNATKLILKQRPLETAKDLHLKSHFIGQPYFEKGEKWPTTKDGIKLNFVFQIFNDGAIALPENIKLLQFYCVGYYEDDFSYDTDSDRWLVKIYENLHKENAIIIDNPDDHTHYCEIEYKLIKSIPDDNDMDDYCKILKLSCVVDYNTPWDDLVGERGFFSQLGGYPQWIQDREIMVNDTVTLLFQLDSEDDAGLMWVDAGMVYVFYDTKNKTIKIIMQYC